MSDASSFRLIRPERKYRSIVFCSSATTPSSIGAIRIFARASQFNWYRGRDVHELAPGLGVAVHVAEGPRPRCRQPSHEILQLRAFIANSFRGGDLEAEAGRETFRGHQAAGLEQHFLLADIGLPGGPGIDRI
jgi:hypothetical protein